MSLNLASQIWRTKFNTRELHHHTYVCTYVRTYIYLRFILWVTISFWTRWQCGIFRCAVKYIMNKLSAKEGWILGTHTSTYIHAWTKVHFFPKLLFAFYPTNPFKALELQNPLHDVLELHKIRRSPDVEALKLWKAGRVLVGGTEKSRAAKAFARLFYGLLFPFSFYFGDGNRYTIVRSSSSEVILKLRGRFLTFGHICLVYPRALGFQSCRVCKPVLVLKFSSLTLIWIKCTQLFSFAFLMK